MLLAKILSKDIPLKMGWELHIASQRLHIMLQNLGLLKLP